MNTPELMLSDFLWWKTDKSHVFHTPTPLSWVDDNHPWEVVVKSHITNKTMLFKLSSRGRVLKCVYYLPQELLTDDKKYTLCFWDARNQFRTFFESLHPDNKLLCNFQGRSVRDLIAIADKL